MKLLVAQTSDIGRVRTNNEDACVHRSDGNGRRGDLLIVADGMGGAQGGEIASHLALEVIADTFFTSTAPTARALSEAFALANSRIYRAAQEQPDVRGMGTTCTAIAISDRTAHVVHVGDSRAYCQRAEGLVRLTRVHSVWAERISESPSASPRETEGRNVLTAVMGVDGDFNPDISEAIAVQPGDRFLLCSDGLWGQVTDPEMQEILLTSPPEEACRRLVALANDRGGPDNVTVMIAEVTADS